MSFSFMFNLVSITNMTCMQMSLGDTMPQTQVGASLISTHLILPLSRSSHTFFVGLASYICISVTDFHLSAIERDLSNTLLLLFRFL